ncbi:Nsp7 replicase family protein [Trichuris trichiura]|uniref:Nsp7 replicase family protein n=1 Tax=Trichuris trichiura TaxID=36087 RepID=A0A077Z6T5_TRITR|nr:Nsp7 replicase family protein [Trichuris trichiura]
MFLRSIVALWLFAWLSMANGNCPTGCICANTVVLCSCSGEVQFDILSPIRGIEYIGKIFVHSCSRLTIPADAFAGLAVGQEISIMEIQNLTIDPFAFRGMLKYPDQFTIRDSAVHLLATDAFAGFQQAKHLWFRNVTIHRVQRNAFRHVSNVDYLYFREVNFETIQSGAFANVQSIGNIFIRSKVNVQRMGSALFRGSKFDKLVIEDATVTSMSAYSLIGAASFGTIQLFNLRILSTSFNVPPDEVTLLAATIKGGKIEFYNVIMDRLHLGIFANVDETRLEHCQIDRLTSGLLTLHRVAVVSFVGSTVRFISSGAFANANQVGTVKFENSNVERIESGSFRHLSAVDYVMLLSTTVGAIETRAFENCTVNNFIIDGCTLHDMSTGSFMGVRSVLCRIVENNINKLSTRLLPDSAFALFSFERNNISGQGASRWLSRMHAQHVNISGNWFVRWEEHLLSEASFRSMELSANQFQCNCDNGAAWLVDMITTRRLYLELAEPIVVINEDNVCWEPQKKRRLSIEAYWESDCSKEKVALKTRSLVHGLTCTVSSLWTECRCRRSATKIVLDFTGASQALNTSVLRISNCTEILLSWSLVGQIQTIIFNSVKLLLAAQVFAKVNGLQSVWIEDSAVRLEGRHVLTTISPLVQVVFKNVDIHQVPVHSLSQSNAAEVTIENSKLGRLEPSMAEGSTIENLIIADSRIGFTSWSAFQGIRGAKLRLTNNIIGHMEGFSFLPAVATEKILCFNGNRIECNSTRDLRAALHVYNSCDNDSNKCYAKGTIEGTMNDLMDENGQKENIGSSLRQRSYYVISVTAFIVLISCRTF